MNHLPKTLVRTAAVMAVSLGFAVAVRAAANPKAGDHPNPKSSEPHPGDARSAEGKAKADASRNAEKDKGSLQRYDTNRNGKLDPDESAAMQADKDKPTERKRGKAKKTSS